MATTATMMMARWPRPLSVTTAPASPAAEDADNVLSAKPTETPRKLKPQALENNAALDDGDDAKGDGDHDTGDGDDDDNQTTDELPSRSNARCRRPMSCHSPRPQRRELKPSESFRRSNQYTLERIQEVDAADEEENEDDTGDVLYDGDSESDEEQSAVVAADRPLDRSASGGELLVQYVDDADTVLCAHRRQRRRQLLLRLGRSRTEKQSGDDAEDQEQEQEEEDDDDDIVRI
ncbi:hypothetical protein PINS_up005312 [Pythium insidiosum]|nr:hypothetical protein PINS_up005312 [Pythium insidiosum]